MVKCPVNNPKATINVAVTVRRPIVRIVAKAKPTIRTAVGLVNAGESLATTS